MWSQADYTGWPKPHPFPLSPRRLEAGCLSNPPHLTSLEGPRVRVKFLPQRMQDRGDSVLRWFWETGIAWGCFWKEKGSRA